MKKCKCGSEPFEPCNCYEDKFKKLCIEYAKNRIALREVKKKIVDMFPIIDGIDCGGEDVNLFIKRKEYKKMYPDCWAGWVDCLQCCDEYTEKEMKFAVLMDEKKGLILEAGNIKQRIYNAGNTLIKRYDDTPTAKTWKT